MHVIITPPSHALLGLPLSYLLPLGSRVNRFADATATCNSLLLMAPDHIKSEKLFMWTYTHSNPELAILSSFGKKLFDHPTAAIALAHY
eukprot:scaffold57950_cov30-Tisochrysis_lutea.AAC.7